MKRNILIGFLIGGISYAVASQFWPKKDSRKSAEKANFSAVLEFTPLFVFVINTYY